MSDNKNKEESNLFEGENVDLTSPATIVPIDETDPAVLGNNIPTEGISRVTIGSFVEDGEKATINTASPLLQNERAVDSVLPVEEPATIEPEEEIEVDVEPADDVDVEEDINVDEDGNPVSDGLDAFRSELRAAVDGDYDGDPAPVNEEEDEGEPVDAIPVESIPTEAVKLDDSVNEHKWSPIVEKDIPIEEEMITEEEEEKPVDLEAEEDDAEYKEFLNDLTDKLHLPATTVDLSDFSVGKPISASSVLSTMNSGKSIDSSDWALHSTGIPITMRKFTGVELKNLQAVSTGRRNRQNAVFERWNLIYEHDANPYKPDNVQDWARCINANDEQDIFFAVYDATFHNANHIPYTCDDPKCGHAFISEHIPTYKMVKFEPEEYEKEFYHIRTKGPSKMEAKANASKRVVPISKDFAIRTKQASIWDVNFMYRLVGEEFFNKYSDTIDVMGYIDELYQIDYANHQIKPISYKKDDDDDDAKLAVNVKNRIIVYNRIIKQLTPDEYGTIISLSKSDPEKGNISYVIPECTCPKCGKTIAETPLDGSPNHGTIEGQLFTRRPLAIIANI